MAEQTDTQGLLSERFKELPKVVQDAITSTDIEKQLRALADTNKLHLDQWEVLENEVMMTLFGVFPLDELETNIQKHVGVSAGVAKVLRENISRIVFEPIREELERSLDNPQAKEAGMTDVERVGAQAIAAEKAAMVTPATPPSTPPEGKVARAPISEAYKAGEPSTERKSVHDDPYREPPA